MPFVQITMLEGRTIEQKHDLIKRLFPFIWPGFWVT